MAMKDPKDVAAMIVGSMKPHGADDMDDEGEGEEVDPGYEAAAEEMMSAFEAKDPKSFARALKDFFDMCM